MIEAVEVEALSGYRVRVRFEDGVEGISDLSRFAGKGVFRVWNEEGVFEGVHVGNSKEIEWSDEIAVCPDALYMEISGKSVEEVFPAAREISLGGRLSPRAMGLVAERTELRREELLAAWERLPTQLDGTRLEAEQ